jgi:L-lactate dehydrogenase complex protein LldE
MTAPVPTRSGPRVALMLTCVADVVAPAVGVATVTLLERLGVSVSFPEEQTCCGQMQINSGYWPEALPLVRHHVEVFDSYEYIVAPSASCVGSVRHQHEQVARHAGDHATAARAADIAGRTYELSQFIVEVLGIDDVGASYPHRVALHPTCHSLRMVGTAGYTEALLQRVRGMTLLHPERADSCCGFGGTFALKNADVSTAMMADKISAIQESGAEVCTAADSSCLLHIGGGLSRMRTGIRVVHAAEILASVEASG